MLLYLVGPLYQLSLTANEESCKFTLIYVIVNLLEFF